MTAPSRVLVPLYEDKKDRIMVAYYYPKGRGEKDDRIILIVHGESSVRFPLKHAPEVIYALTRSMEES